MKIKIVLLGVILMATLATPSFAQSIGFDVHLGPLPFFVPPVAVYPPQLVYYNDYPGPYGYYYPHRHRHWPIYGAAYYRYPAAEYRGHWGHDRDWHNHDGYRGGHYGREIR